MADERLDAALAKCRAIGDNVQIALDAKYQLEGISRAMSALGLMPEIALELRLIGDEIYQSAKSVSGADALATNAQIKGHREFMGEALMALLNNAEGIEVRQGGDAKQGSTRSAKARPKGSAQPIPPVINTGESE